MLLVVVAPAVSRSMPFQPTMSNMGDGCMMGMEHADHHASGAPSDPGDVTAKCGYCTLLAHTPLVAFDVGVVLAPAYLTALTPEARSPRSEPIAQLLSAHPRGPPDIG